MIEITPAGPGECVMVPEGIPFVMIEGDGYRRRGGRIGKRNTPPEPAHLIVDGKTYRQEVQNHYWIGLGHAPRPTTTWGWQRYHVLHGLLMGYPIVDIIAFVISDVRRRRAKRPKDALRSNANRNTRRQQ